MCVCAYVPRSCFTFSTNQPCPVSVENTVTQINFVLPNGGGGGTKIVSIDRQLSHCHIPCFVITS